MLACGETMVLGQVFLLMLKCTRELLVGVFPINGVIDDYMVAIDYRSRSDYPRQVFEGSVFSGLGVRFLSLVYMIIRWVCRSLPTENSRGNVAFEALYIYRVTKCRVSNGN